MRERIKRSKSLEMQEVREMGEKRTERKWVFQVYEWDDSGRFPTRGEGVRVPGPVIKRKKEELCWFKQVL